MATISYSFNVTNGSGSYTVQVQNCSGTSTIYTQNISGQSTSGTVNGTLSDAILNGDLGSVRLYIFDTNNNSVVNTSGCFNHNCSSCVSITDFTLSTPTASLNYADDINCIISGVDGNSPHSYYFTLKQGGSVIATNSNNSSNVFTFTNNLCHNAGTITVDASVVNCGGTVNKTNTITINPPIPDSPILSVCYLGSTQWKFTAVAPLYPESLLALYEEVGNTLVGYVNIASASTGEITLESPVYQGYYYAKHIVCGVSSAQSVSAYVTFTPSC